MPISFRITAVTEKGDFVSYFGQLVFSGSYTTGQGGDTLVNAAGSQAPELFPPGTPANTAGLPVFLLGQTAPHVTRPPLVYNLQLDGGYIASLSVGTSAFNFKIKIYTASGTELGTGAYPAGLTGNVFHTLALDFKKNI